jgi:hypothetical protein
VEEDHPGSACPYDCSVADVDLFTAQKTGFNGYWIAASDD